MSDKSKNNYGIINAEVPECVDKALANLTEKPTKMIGDTIADIWSLVFGGIGHIAEKRRLRYATELEKYNKELQEKINEIPEEKRIEPDLQVIAPTLEASKYCVEKEEIRKMFVNLVASSINSDKAADVHPIFTDIITKLSQTDALLFQAIAKKEFGENSIVYKTSIEHISFSLTILEQLGLIEQKKEERTNSNDFVLYKNKHDYHLNDNANDRYYWLLFDNTKYERTKYTMLQYIKQWSKQMSESSTALVNVANIVKNIEINKTGMYFPEHEAIGKFFIEYYKLTSLGKRFKRICL